MGSKRLVEGGFERRQDAYSSAPLGTAARQDESPNLTRI
jgi:hypothetical protein